tara:strand:- start:96 stop:413 length:318 start_codon:yes stop_codon:yes gene_type:complete
MSKKFEEDKIDTEELKENVFNQGKWLRLLWLVLFSFIYWWAAVVLYVIGILQFLFNLFTGSPNSSLSELAALFREWMVQIINFVTYQEKDKPYPFSELPKVKGKK